MKFSILALFFFTLPAFAMSGKPQQSRKPVINKTRSKSVGYYFLTMQSEDHHDGDITIKAHIVAQKAMPAAQFKWQLPKNAVLKSGDLNGSTSLNVGDEKHFEVVISKQELNEKDQFFFFIFQEINGEKHGGSGSLVFHSEAQETEPKLQKSHRHGRKKGIKLYE